MSQRRNWITHVTLKTQDERVKDLLRRHHQRLLREWPDVQVLETKVELVAKTTYVVGAREGAAALTDPLEVDVARHDRDA